MSKLTKILASTLIMAVVLPGFGMGMGDVGTATDQQKGDCTVNGKVMSNVTQKTCTDMKGTFTSKSDTSKPATPSTSGMDMMKKDSSSKTSTY